MFENLSKKLTASLDKLRGRGALSESDVDAALRDIRIALLEADVALPVVKHFTATVREKMIGAKIVESVQPAQMVVKLVHDALVELLGAENSELALNVAPPAVILMVGLQGSGKTTTTGKLALFLKDKQRKKILLASLDVYRPAAQAQLATVANTAGVTCLDIVAGEMPEAITERALKAARLGGYDVLLLDTAGRLHIDAELMQELAQVKKLSNPCETLLVADALTGQDALTIASEFHEKIGITGIILTRTDGDGRGGAALSMRHVTGQPIKFVGAGEKLSDLEPFHPDRIASRILDMGDVVSLVERAAAAVSEADAEAMAKKMLGSGGFDFNDMLTHLRQIGNMGGLNSMLGMLPGMGRIKEKMAEATIDEQILKKQEAIILSMTHKERSNPKLLAASRKRRIAKGAGVTVQDVNRLFKQYQQMETMMKQFKKLGRGGMMNPLKLKQMFGGNLPF
jgi:signal recognition particle subunit SRP54